MDNNLDIIKCVDWFIDSGPYAGNKGGEVVSIGTPEDIARNDFLHRKIFKRVSCLRNKDLQSQIILQEKESS
jgi:excinuclease ABC subunit A